MHKSIVCSTTTGAVVLDATSSMSRVAAASGTLCFGQLRARYWDHSSNGGRGYSSLGTTLSMAGAPRFATTAVVSAAPPVSVHEQLSGC